MLIVTSRMRRIIEVDPDSRRAVVEPGVTNLAVSKAAEPFGYFYAPDPSSQVICSVGGNVAENSGGAHCLKHGFTVHHVTGAGGRHPGRRADLAGRRHRGRARLRPAGRVHRVRGHAGHRHQDHRAADQDPGGGDHAAGRVRHDRRGRRRGRPRSSRPGIVPAAIEMMDALAIEAAEAAVHCNYPAGAGAVLIVELDGPAADVEARDRGGRAALRAGRRDRDPGRGRPGRAGRRSGRGRKSAFAAVGRISPAYIVQDGVVPRTALPDVLDRIAELSAETGHPGGQRVPRRRREPAPAGAVRRRHAGAREAAEELSGAILDLCIEHGGSITGEHGVGVDKSRYMPKMFSADDLDTMQLVRCAFDPRGLCNPGKIFPTPRLCGEVPGVRREPHPLVAAGQAEQF